MFSLDISHSEHAPAFPIGFGASTKPGLRASRQFGISASVVGALCMGIVLATLAERPVISVPPRFAATVSIQHIGAFLGRE